MNSDLAITSHVVISIPFVIPGRAANADDIVSLNPFGSPVARYTG